jgi:hypothetical protein
MPSNNFPNIGFTTLGRDFNFFQKVTVTWSTFGAGSVNGVQPDLIVTMPTAGFLLFNEDSTSIVQVSYNGTTVHDELNPALASRGIAYDNRTVSTIWFRLSSGASAVVAVRAWGSK